ncbi:Uma2 family endonuclease [Limnoraphis robusta Tam1]|uniref:Uma2 family endonuclease n=1 Tax=Limnoraphis robusta CCNP1315 TaxID=3110306 RepID=A0ABU5U4F4_9CYAN|nr:Uma2 family endonuclease [Limnoraphis robusta]MEA5521950.1 Uma2 family endonuclease [Limnoraphis robusta CCNP1315]MEA5537488.1 Uma2 family endonuclease [Limnoraphis robusta Tam1]MEA5547391.1 Uma2 family endonuclease [Limnoraphis robusta CCNP1324]
MAIATPKRFTVAEYHRLTELGFFTEDDRVELISGEFFDMAAKGTPHAVCETRLERELYKLIGDKATLRGQQPIILSSNSEPEPDRVIVVNREDDYLSSHPTADDILLLIEISDSSLDYDQDVKLRAYAENNIKEYWIFNLIDYQLECYSEPYQKLDQSFGYRRKLIMLSNESVILPGFPELSLELSKIFPPLFNS